MSNISTNTIPLGKNPKLTAVNLSRLDLNKRKSVSERSGASLKKETGVEVAMAPMTAEDRLKKFKKVGAMIQDPRVRDVLAEVKKKDKKDVRVDVEALGAASPRGGNDDVSCARYIGAGLRRVGRLLFQVGISATTAMLGFGSIGAALTASGIDYAAPSPGSHATNTTISSIGSPISGAVTDAEFVAGNAGAVLGVVGLGYVGSTLFPFFVNICCNGFRGYAVKSDLSRGERAKVEAMLHVPGYFCFSFANWMRQAALLQHFPNASMEQQIISKFLGSGVGGALTGLANGLAHQAFEGRFFRLADQAVNVEDAVDSLKSAYCGPCGPGTAQTREVVTRTIAGFCTVALANIGAMHDVVSVLKTSDGASKASVTFMDGFIPHAILLVGWFLPIALMNVFAFTSPADIKKGSFEPGSLEAIETMLMEVIADDQSGAKSLLAATVSRALRESSADQASPPTLTNVATKIRDVTQLVDRIMGTDDLSYRDKQCRNLHAKLKALGLPAGAAGDLTTQVERLCARSRGKTWSSWQASDQPKGAGSATKLFRSQALIVARTLDAFLPGRVFPTDVVQDLTLIMTSDPSILRKYAGGTDHSNVIESDEEVEKGKTPEDELLGVSVGNDSDDEQDPVQTRNALLGSYLNKLVGGRLDEDESESLGILFGEIYKRQARLTAEDLCKKENDIRDELLSVYNIFESKCGNIDLDPTAPANDEINNARDHLFAAAALLQAHEVNRLFRDGGINLVPDLDPKIPATISNLLPHVSQEVREAYIFQNVSDLLEKVESALTERSRNDPDINDRLESPMQDLLPFTPRPEVKGVEERAVGTTSNIATGAQNNAEEKGPPKTSVAHEPGGSTEEGGSIGSVDGSETVSE